MSDVTRLTGILCPRGKYLTRRGVLGGVAGAGLMYFISVPPAQASAALSGQRLDMALRVTRVMAQFPVEFPTLGDKPPALAQVGSARLKRAARRLTGEHLAQACAAADGLIADGLLRQRPQVLVTILGKRAARDGEATPLASLVALSVATLGRGSDPNDDGFARTWLGTLARMHKHDTLGDAVTRRGIR